MTEAPSKSLDLQAARSASRTLKSRVYSAPRDVWSFLHLLLGLCVMQVMNSWLVTDTFGLDSTHTLTAAYSGLLIRNLIQVTRLGKPYELLYIPIMVS